MTFRMHFEGGRSGGSGACRWKGLTLEVMVDTRPMLIFDQMRAPVLEIMDQNVDHLIH
jgi:hypothetical protein